MSGGYAGAKRMLWIMAKYANGISAEKGLGIYFQAIVPLQIIGGTGVGDGAPTPMHGRWVWSLNNSWLASVSPLHVVLFLVVPRACPCGGWRSELLPGRLKRWRDRPRHTLQQRC